MWTETRRPYPLPQWTGHEVCLEWVTLLLLAAAVVVVFCLCQQFLNLGSVFRDIRACFSPGETICYHYKKTSFKEPDNHHQTHEAFVWFGRSFPLMIISVCLC